MEKLKLSELNKTGSLVKSIRTKALKEEQERIQVYLAKTQVDKLKDEWKASGIKTFSSFFLWKITQKGVLD
jgi:hypothetical protein